MKHYKGFSIVEILLTICIIGILTAAASYTYSKYAAKSQITAANRILESYIKDAQNYFADNNSFPGASNIAPYTPATNDVISGISVSNSFTATLPNNCNPPAPTGGISGISLNATFSNKAASDLQGKTLTMNLVLFNGTSCISCVAGNISFEYLPGSCQNTSNQCIPSFCSVSGNSVTCNCPPAGG